MNPPHPQHRTLQPSGPPNPGSNAAQSHARLTEAFDAIRHEFDAANADLSLLRNQRDDLEAKGDDLHALSLAFAIIFFFFFQLHHN